MPDVIDSPGSSAAERGGRLPHARLWPGLLVVLLGALVFALDQWTKTVALRQLAPGERIPVVQDWLSWQLVFNPGAAFSLGQSITPVFTLFQALVAIAVLVMAWRLRSLWWAIALGFVLGGAAGNLFDRLFRPPSFGHGHVVDFVALPNFPVFNVADMSITTAAVMIIVAAFAGWEAFEARRSASGPAADRGVAGAERGGAERQKGGSHG